MQNRIRPLALAVAAALPLITHAAEAEMDAIVVTAPVMKSAVELDLNTKNAIQPLPANDGAALLKAVPNMSVIRKGGTHGDLVFRGMAGSRVNILLDGEQIYGGCGGRMDPPTAYVFPDTYDKVTIIKGPQSVAYAPGGSAATVMFERKPIKFAEAGVKGFSSLTVGSNGRHDEVLDVSGGFDQGYVRATGTNSAADDYRDGDNKKVHSKYKRSSAGAAIGWTPDQNTVLELSATRSSAQASNASTSVDGSKFDRDNLTAKFEKKNISDLVEKVEALVYYNKVEHVMDNFSLRPLSGTKLYMAPNRETTGYRVATTLTPTDSLKLTLGVDNQENNHTNQNMDMMGVIGARTEDAKYKTNGLFVEATQHLNSASRVIGGLRLDQWKATDSRVRGMPMMMNGKSTTGGESREETLRSGFARYESDLNASTMAYVGFGHTERAPDYWETMKTNNAVNTSSMFIDIKPEKTNQVDVGVNWKSGPLSAFASAFYSKVADYILIRRVDSMTATARNVDATIYGGEIGGHYALSNSLKAGASLAYVHGNNDTDGTPLAQMSAPEARFTLDWKGEKWSAGSLLRTVAKQNRFVTGEGNIAGQDVGATGGFATLSVNGGYKISKTASVSAGIDNVFNRTYSENMSKGTDASMANFGYPVTTRINEPGRTLWLRGQIAF